MSKGWAGAFAMKEENSKVEEKKHIAQLEEAFRKADANGDGRLSMEEYHKILLKYNISCTKEELDSWMKVVDKDGDGYISKAEFLGEPEKNEAAVEKAKKAFNLMDRNHDGYITKKEMMQLTKKLTQKQVNAVFERNDADKDGKLSKEEFTEMMVHNTKK